MEERRAYIKVFRSTAYSRRHSFRNHHHTAFEISYIESGKGIYKVGDREFPISDGDIFLYHTNEPHCITDIDDDAPMQILNIHFEPRFFWSMYGDVPLNRYYQVFFERSRRGDNRLSKDNALNGMLCKLMLEIGDEWNGMLEGCEEMIKLKLMSILILLQRYEKAPVKELPTPVSGSRLAQIGKSMEYICSHIDEDLTLDSIAEIACMSRTYYCSVFKSLNGITPWEYVNIKRIDSARELLRDSDKLILDIALQCGFNNSANFNRIFKKVTGLTPQHYRATHRLQ